MTDRVLVILGHFLHFDPSNNPKNQNFEKLKKMPADIIILHLCTANDNHMMYDSRDIQYGARQTEFFFILDYFLPFYHTIDPKIKIRKKIKKSPGDIILLHMCSYEDHIICSS